MRKVIMVGAYTPRGRSLIDYIPRVLDHIFAVEFTEQPHLLIPRPLRQTPYRQALLDYVHKRNYKETSYLEAPHKVIRQYDIDFAIWLQFGPTRNSYKQKAKSSLEKCGYRLNAFWKVDLQRAKRIIEDRTVRETL